MLPVDLSAGLFDHAKPVHLDPGQTLFLGGDPGDGCYRVDEGRRPAGTVSSRSLGLE
jgi:CRP-like cAMP-binding protein